MITKITMNKSWAIRVNAKTKKVIKFKSGINLLIGPNKSGKSSVLAAILKHIDNSEYKLAPIECVGTKTVRYFDFEKDNTRTVSHFRNDISMGYQITSRWKSHGEVSKDIIRSLKESEFDNTIILMDEPDQALDIDGIIELIEILKESKAEQIIMTCHHPLLILSDLYCIELQKNYKEFVLKQIKRLI